MRQHRQMRGGIISHARVLYGGGVGAKVWAWSVDPPRKHKEAYVETNLYANTEKIEFEDIHSDNEIEAMTVVKKILEIWDLGNSKNCMRINNVI